MMKDFLVYIGRFQPLHKGHLDTIQYGIKHSKHLIIICGSANSERTLKNPFTVGERANMIINSLRHEDQSKVTITSANDSKDDNDWVDDVINTVKCIRFEENLGEDGGILGYKKDDSSYYLDIFKDWEYLESETKGVLNATDIREAYFKKGVILSQSLPKTSIYFLEEFKSTKEYTTLTNERN